MDEEFAVTRRPSVAPEHPGPLIAEVIDEALHLSVSEAARRLGVSRQALHAIFCGRAALTPDMAVRLGRLFGKSPVLWLRMQTAHDLWHAENRLAENEVVIKPAVAARAVASKAASARGRASNRLAGFGDGRARAAEAAPKKPSGGGAPRKRS
jgi:addiction module HigA family antidote